LILVLSDDCEFLEESKGDNEKMIVISLETSGEYLYDSCFPHFLLNCRVVADVEENVEADEEKFILFPY
jgi:hypothetical protein